jgi:hypothetical protein
MLQRFVAASSARAAPFSSAARKASGTPLSALDPPGYPTVEATYAKIASNLCVHMRANCAYWRGAVWRARRLGFGGGGGAAALSLPSFSAAARAATAAARLSRAQDHRAQDAEEQAADAG